MSQSRWVFLALWASGCVTSGTVDPADGTGGSDNLTAHGSPPDLGGGPALHPDLGGAKQPSVTLPPALDRIGIYDWNVDGAVVAGQDRLVAPGKLALALGAATLRLTLTTRDDYGVYAAAGVQGSDYTLKQLASGAIDGSGTDRIGYRTLIADPRLHNVLLTTYGRVDYQLDFSRPLDPATRASVRGEIAELGKYLLETYPGKRFVLCPWEGDNAMTLDFGSGSVESVDGPGAWDVYTDWLRARAEGIADARAQVPGATSSLYSCLEFNAWKRTDNGQICGTSPATATAPSNRCVISYVAPQLAGVVDYFSYSSWQSMSPTVATDLPRALDAAASYLPGVDHARFLLGEFGGAREDWNECGAAKIASDAIDAALGWGVSFTNFWQIGDNARDGSLTGVGFGAYKIGGALSLTGQMLAQRLGGGAVSLPDVTQCPSITAWQNAKDYSQTLHAGDYVALYGTFTAGGDRITFHGPTSSLTQAQGDVPYFFDGNHTQINAMVPASDAGTARIRISATDRNGRDSNALIVPLAP